MTSPAHQTADRYVELVNAGDLDGLVGLFQPDATVLHPQGSFTGHDAIRGFYSESVLAFSPCITATSWVDEGSTCVFEMDASVGDNVSKAIDHLTVSEGGRMTRLAIYYR